MEKLLAGLLPRDVLMAYFTFNTTLTCILYRAVSTTKETGKYSMHY